jgi:hypothetical protein
MNDPVRTVRIGWRLGRMISLGKKTPKKIVVPMRSDATEPPALSVPASEAKPSG